MLKEPEFWILNYSTKAIKLKEFNLILQPKQRINLLHRKMNLTQEQINKSIESGDLKKYKNKLIISSKQKILLPEALPKQSEHIMEMPDRSIVKQEVTVYDELLDEPLDDEEFLIPKS